MADKSEQEMASRQKKRSPWLIIFGVALFVAIIAIAAYLFTPGLFSGGNAEERAKAESAIRSVVKAAESYRLDNDDVYEGLTAAKIKSLTGGVTVVDGIPKKAGQVGISDYNSSQLVLLYKGKSGRDYKATVKTGAIEFNF